MSNPINRHSKIKICKQYITTIGVGIALGVSLGAALDHIRTGHVIGIVIGV